jgi:hypothetical protein
MHFLFSTSVSTIDLTVNFTDQTGESDIIIQEYLV